MISIASSIETSLRRRPFSGHSSWTEVTYRGKRNMRTKEYFVGSSEAAAGVAADAAVDGDDSVRDGTGEGPGGFFESVSGHAAAGERAAVVTRFGKGGGGMMRSSTLKNLPARSTSSPDPEESRPFLENAAVPPEIWSSLRFLALFVS